jgi:hypothetical protein
LNLIWVNTVSTGRLLGASHPYLSYAKNPVDMK